jgi:integrase
VATALATPRSYFSSRTTNGWSDEAYLSRIPGRSGNPRERNSLWHYGPGNGAIQLDDPPTVDEIVAVMRHTPNDRHGRRLRAMIVVLWRAGLRIQEAPALTEHDLDERRGSLLVRHGKGGRRRDVSSRLGGEVAT